MGPINLTDPVETAEHKRSSSSIMQFHAEAHCVREDIPVPVPKICSWVLSWCRPARHLILQHWAHSCQIGALTRKYGISLSLWGVLWPFHVCPGLARHYGSPLPKYSQWRGNTEVMSVGSEGCVKCLTSQRCGAPCVQPGGLCLWCGFHSHAVACIYEGAWTCLWLVGLIPQQHRQQQLLVL